MAVTFTATTEPATASVRLQASGLTTGPVTVTRVVAGVGTPVRGGVNLPLPAGAFTLIDYEAPFGVPILYTITDPGGITNLLPAITTATGWNTGWTTGTGTTTWIDNHPRLTINQGLRRLQTATPFDVLPAGTYTGALQYKRFQGTTTAIGVNLLTNTKPANPDYLQSGVIQTGVVVAAGSSSDQTVTSAGFTFTVPAGDNTARLDVYADTGTGTAVVDVLAFTFGPIGAGSITNSNTVTLAPDTPWLTHPGVVGLGAPVVVISDDVQWSARTVIHDLIGRPDPVVTAQPMDIGAGTLALDFADVPAADQIVEVCADGWPILLRTPCADKFRDGWLAVERISEKADHPRTATRIVELSYRRVGRPSDDAYTTLPWRLMDVDANFGTLLSVDQSYATLADVDAGLPV